MVLEEGETGLRFVPWSTYSKGKKIIKIVTPPKPLDAGVDALMIKLGEGYDFTGLIGQGWVVAWKRWAKRKVKNPFSNADRMWCSEAIVWAMQHCPGYEHSLSVDPEASTPGDVDDLLSL